MILVHHHLIVAADIRRVIKDTEEAKKWLKMLIDKVGLQSMGEVQCEYSKVIGNRGITALAMVTTSHIGLHIWDEEIPAKLQFDLYSCASFTHIEIIKEIEEKFKAISISYKYIDRDNNLIPYHHEHI